MGHDPGVVGHALPPSHQRSLDYQWLHNPFQEETSIDKTASSNKWLSEPAKRSGPPLLSKRLPPETGNRDSTPQTVPGVQQLPLPGPKPENKWRPVIDLSHLNTFLQVQKFKMETPEIMGSHKGLIKHMRVGVLNIPL